MPIYLFQIWKIVNVRIVTLSAQVGRVVAGEGKKSQFFIIILSQYSFLSYHFLFFPLY